MTGAYWLGPLLSALAGGAVLAAAIVLVLIGFGMVVFGLSFRDAARHVGSKLLGL